MLASVITESAPTVTELLVAVKSEMAFKARAPAMTILSPLTVTSLSTTLLPVNEAEVAARSVPPPTMYLVSVELKVTLVRLAVLSVTKIDPLLLCRRPKPPAKVVLALISVGVALLADPRLRVLLEMVTVAVFELERA